jgi:glutathione S-transferase
MIRSMALTLYSHPFSSYCQKVLVALWENDVAFTYRHLEAPGAAEERARLWPLGRFPVLVDDGQVVVESSIIIEHLDLHHPGPVRLVPDAREPALEVRFMDRFFDNYVMSAMQKPVLEALKGERGRTDEARAEAHLALDTAYAWLEERLAGRTWAAGEAFSMADCAAAPSLFYADWVPQIGPAFPRLRAYRSRLLARPSFTRAVDEGRPYRHYFPLGAPNRD